MVKIKTIVIMTELWRRDERNEMENGEKTVIKKKKLECVKM